jgi:hypothetical protein
VSDAYQDQEQRIARQNSKTNTAKTCVSSNQNTTQQITKNTKKESHISCTTSTQKQQRSKTAW